MSDPISFKSASQTPKQKTENLKWPYRTAKSEQRKLLKKDCLRCKVDGAGEETELEGVERSFISRS